MADPDPLVPVLAGVVVDTVRFLDTCGDDEVDPDVAVGLMESVAGVLQRLPADQLACLLRSLADLADAESDPQRRAFLESFPSACGLVDEEA
ncbi:hypothetical protein [Kitasatospora sp. NPDC059571]|uniref:hypothetical protein n=1 Tax=Kitasatospora sp. NPDC059571 TaxID=3346871 RepID=UPI0036B1A19F